MFSINKPRKVTPPLSEVGLDVGDELAFRGNGRECMEGFICIPREPHRPA